MPGLDAVLAAFAPRAEGTGRDAEAAWAGIEKIPGVVWVGAGPRRTDGGFERDGVGVLHGLGAVEMTARGPPTGVVEIDVLVTSPYVTASPDAKANPYAKDDGPAPLGAGFAATAVERLGDAATACAVAYRATLPGRRAAYLSIREAGGGTVIAFRRQAPVCS
jgi:hypothetical protein